MIAHHVSHTTPLVRGMTLCILRRLSTTPRKEIAQVSQLLNWNLESFRKHAFTAKIPMTLPCSKGSLPPACHKWFIHDNKVDHDLEQQPQTSKLRTSFWSEHEDTPVPLELTSTSTEDNSSSFQRTHAPLKFLLTYLGNPRSPTQSTLKQAHSIYLAQCDLTSLPQQLQLDLPTPELVTSTGKGDIYSSSLWLGRPPTYTPLHRDPNPNLFLQIAGHKQIRLFAPDIGDAIFDDVQQRLASTHPRGNSSASFRGEEMMAGPEKQLLHDIVWSDEDSSDSGVLAYALEARLGLGEALFIPKGWWHSVRGVGDGVTASANWWFR